MYACQGHQPPLTSETSEFETKSNALVEFIFTKFDADNSGSIDMEEAKSIFIEQLKKSGATKLKVDDSVLEEYFNKADTNNDNGSYSSEEAEAFCLNKEK